jgi:bifunctional N-acetylglucosamine-1-phosphate-uridyltransferase/glucosamine-1-phosphate-acetyltransferase GlmU-like protein
MAPSPSGVAIGINVVIDKKWAIGNSCHINNSVLITYVEVAYFNSAGDSDLNTHVHLAVGPALSHLRFD